MKHIRRSLLFIPLMLATLVVLVAANSYSAVAPLQPAIANGGRAVAIAVNPANASRMIVASESGGLFRTLNGGLNWSQVSGSSTFWYTDVAYLPSNPNIVLATANADMRVVSGGGIWRSTTAGTGWAHVAITPPTADCAASFAAYALAAETTGSRVWAGTLCGLAHSDDQGATWTYLPVVTGYDNDKIYAVLAPAAGRLVILTDAGLKISTDSGATWSLASSGLPGNIMVAQHNQIAVSPINPDHLFWGFNYWFYNTGTSSWEGHVALYRSTDNGSSWSSVFDNPGLNRPPFVRAANALSGSGTQYDVYFADGGCTLKRATAGPGAALSAWTTLNFDHCDPADLAFSTDHKTPLLLVTDGGVHNTPDAGLNWHLVGGGAGGYNALQITELTGQLHSGSGADLYFATQDNGIWASPNTGISWPNSICCEGFFLNIPREFHPASVTKLTGVACGACYNFMSGPLLAGSGGFTNPPNDNGNPRLLSLGKYVQNTKIPGSTDSIFDLTLDNGASWVPRYGFPEEVRDLSKVAGPVANPVVYTAIKTPGLTPGGDEIVQIKRIASVLGSSTPLVSNVGGFGSLGIFPTMFAWYKPFGVDPNDPNYLILSDIVSHRVKVSNDAGASWVVDTALTNLVTHSGTFKFNSGPFTQITTYGFDPTCAPHIVVGTQQAGIFQTFDRGGTWSKLDGSEKIPEVSSVFFPGGGKILFSSYGRGIWSYTYTCPTHVLPPPHIFVAAPLIYWKGGMVPLNQIHNPEVCPVCGYYLNVGGDILDYRVNPRTKALTEVTISGGRIRGFTWDGQPLPLPFRVVIGTQRGSLGGDKELLGLLNGKARLKGLFVEKTTLRGLILNSRDVKVSQLPKTRQLPAHITLTVNEPQQADALQPIVLTGTGFDPQFTLDVRIDGRAVKPDSIKFDSQGNFTMSITPLLNVGGHKIVVSEQTDKGLIQDATTFIVTVDDEADNK